MMTFGTSAVAHPKYCVWVIAIFMFIFSINFNLFYLILTGKVLEALFSEELRWFVATVVAATAFIAFTVTFSSLKIYGTFGDGIRHAFFQVSTIISTTGFATDDFNLWPNASKIMLLVLMFVGACGNRVGLVHKL